MGEALEVARVMVEPATKLLEAVQSAIGKAYEPRHVRRLADAKAYEISVVGQAMRETSDIPITYKKGDIELDTTDFDSFIKRTQSRLAYQELIKQQNIEEVVDRAYQMLEGESPVINEPVDQGWLLRFMDSVEDISDLDLQKLWAKILSGEIKQPKSFSLRTLETLRNISSDEAKLFEQLCDYILVAGDKCFLPRYRSLEDTYKIAYGSILRLGECGLINADGMIGLTVNTVKGRTHITNNGKIVIVAEAEDDQQKLSISQYPLTSVGVEIFKLLRHEVSDSYILDFAKELKKEEGNIKIKIRAYSILEITDGQINFEEKDLLSDNSPK